MDFQKVFAFSNDLSAFLNGQLKSTDIPTVLAFKLFDINILFPTLLKDQIKLQPSSKQNVFTATYFNLHNVECHFDCLLKVEAAFLRDKDRIKALIALCSDFQTVKQLIENVNSFNIWLLICKIFAEEISSDFNAISLFPKCMPMSNVKI
eukprot:NODE_97_length_20652_cov_0.832093.p14 type:complete len:150 gc:universal NODE_97_length_20652_cov_0.832093:18026-18475(+)